MSVVTFEIDEEIKRKADIVLATTGVSAATAIQKMFAQIAEEGALPAWLTDQLREEEIIAEMPAFRERTTGVSNTIFISAKVPRHVPRIKVAVDPPTHLNRFGDNASVAVADGITLEGKLPSRVHRQVTRFLDLNRDVLIDYWEQRIDDDELRERLRSIAD
jgi:antitoxin component of RelBE/YafQ-DinJ toxin-antitoxin module